MNIPLAVESDTLYGQLTIPMTIGDQLFVYTDGILDAPSPEGECFGSARLKNVLDANIKTPLSELKSAILETLYEHTKKELTHDDITMIALEIGPKANALRKEEPMIPEKQIKAFNEFYNTARNNEILDSLLSVNGALPWRSQGRRNHRGRIRRSSIYCDGRFRR
jgi:hypothetical protein